MKLTALLPMKGHSERVSNKNMKEFAGKPLYHAIMQSLQKSKYIEKVIIDTDSDIIAKDALVNFEKVQIIDRPKEIQGDFVPMNDIIDYDLTQLDEEHFLQTHSTNPLLTAETINRAIESYFANLENNDSLFSVTKIQTRLYWTDGTPINHNLKELLRTQDLPIAYEENSNIYIFSKKSFKKAGNRRIGLSPLMFEMNKLEAIDIDEAEDFILAELLHKWKRGDCL
jgi:N-acylneuraminate cytidylyltransferase